MSEWNDPDDLEGQDSDEAGDSSPPESGEAGASNPGSEEEMIRQNAELRRQLRAERAGRLVERHRLPGPYRDLLRDVPRDQQESRARQYAEELAQRYPDTDSDPDLDPPTPARTSSASDEEPAPDDAVLKLREEIRGAKGWRELQDLQDAQPRSWQKDREATQGATMPEEAKNATSWDGFVEAIDKARDEARTEARKAGR